MAIVKTKQYVLLPGFLDVKIEMLLPNVYQDFQETVGIFSPGASYRPALRLSTNELRRNGVLVKLTVRTENKISYEIYCSSEKLSTALPGLVGRNIAVQSSTGISQQKIVKVSIARKRSRS